MWNEEKLADLPVINGFRQRGLDMTRIETFTDAAFAFALTLLVISFDNIPNNIEELTTALKSIPAFAVSFSLISVFWFAHHKWSRRFGLDDTITVLLSLTFVFITLVFVFPLRLMSSAFMAWLSSGWVPFEFGEYTAARIGFIFAVYGVAFTLMCSVLALLYRHALTVDELKLNAQERFIARAEMQAWSIMLSAGLMSTAIATLTPEQIRPLAGWSYALLGIVMPLFSVWKSRQEPDWSSPSPG